MRRWDLAVFLGVLLGPALALGSCVALRQRTGDLEERLVRDSSAVISASHPRSVHTGTAHPGSFGEALQAHLPAIEKLAPAAKAEELDPIRAVVAGDAPLSSLPPHLSELLARAAPDLDAILAGTRAERADFPEDRESLMPVRGATWDGFRLSVLLAGLRTRRELEAGRAQAAATACLDGLAMGRDIALGGGLVGHMIQVGVARRLVPPCAAAIAALPAGAAREALAEVQRIREALPPFSATMHEELVWLELTLFGRSLAPSATAKLGPQASAIVAENEPGSAWERLVRRDAWRGVIRNHDLLLELADLSPESRDRGISAAQSEQAQRLNPLARMTAPYVRYARRSDAGGLLLDALSLAAAASVWRAENGAWPEDVDTLTMPGLLGEELASRVGDDELQTHDDGALELVLPLPQGDPARDPDELRLTLAASTP